MLHKFVVFFLNPWLHFYLFTVVDWNIVFLETNYHLISYKKQNKT